jgi:hypothetical protein
MYHGCGFEPALETTAHLRAPVCETIYTPLLDYSPLPSKLSYRQRLYLFKLNIFSQYLRMSLQPVDRQLEIFYGSLLDF